MAMDQAMNTAELAIAPGVREVASEDGAVLLDVEQGVCFSLNPVGLKIWELLKKGCSLDQIADALGQEFPVSRPQLLSDAMEFIAALEAKQLIRRPNQATPKRSGFFENLLRRKKLPSAQ
jgi:Coenzyme PQQ synthesis protein D (PqqD)